MDIVFLLKLIVNIVFLLLLVISGILVATFYILNFIRLCSNIADWIMFGHSNWEFYTPKDVCRFIFKNIINK